MKKVYLLDCTLRDGGYVNDWRFGEAAIRGFGNKIAQTGIEYFEVGFIKGDEYDSDRSVFPDIESFKQVITPKAEDMEYLGMLDMSAPVPKERIADCDGSSIDGIRVIFKKDKADEAYEYCQHIKSMGYKLFVNFVGTDQYSEEELADAVERFNDIEPYGMSIVDTFGVIKRRACVHMARLMDRHMKPGIALCYHAHNNLQQAFSNAEALTELELDRDLVIDACVFGMGRGAGNLNLELFAEYMNEEYGAHYRIEPMLEIMDEYLNDIYKTKFWGYSLPLYLSAKNGCHPNYAIYLAQKDSFTEKSFNELLKSILPEDKVSFDKDRAERYYREYLQNYIDDKQALDKLRGELAGRDIVILAPGSSIRAARERILARKKTGSVVIALNFRAEEYSPDYIFSSNMRRYVHIQGRTDARCITTSNMRDVERTDYVINFASCESTEAKIIDNSGLMLLRLLNNLGIRKVSIAGMDGYSSYQEQNYCNEKLAASFPEDAKVRNELIAKELDAISRVMELEFMTDSQYMIGNRK